MEWQGIIKSKCSQPLGTLESVAVELTALFPALSFHWTKTGAEQLAMLDARGTDVPSLVRQVMAAKKSHLCGSVTDGELSASFNLGTDDPVTRVWTTVGGEQAVVERALGRLQQRPGWVLESPEPLDVWDLTSHQAPQLTGDATLFIRPSQPTESSKPGGP